MPLDTERWYLGYFGKTPVAPSPEIVAIAQEQLKLEPTTESPLTINDRDPQKGVAACRMMLDNEGLPVSDENIFIIASCAEKGVAFLKGQGTIGVRKENKKLETSGSQKKNVCSIKLDGESYNVKLEESKVIVNGQSYNYEIEDGQQENTAVSQSSGDAQPIVSVMPGLILRVNKKVGDAVKLNETVVVLESMKMETELNSSVSGQVVSINVAPSQQIQAGTVVATVRKIG